MVEERGRGEGEREGKGEREGWRQRARRRASGGGLGGSKLIGKLGEGESEGKRWVCGNEKEKEKTKKK